ncbi:MAG TPA: adenosylmethionine decarboxylase [Planctomycetota bacterium]|jgi:S-adenosylmethionine decarboxylase proenzyme|nr:adenosylmethionine decarboxylase [Planctomycetota bacterium]
MSAPGVHWLLDFEGCPFEALDRAEGLRAALLAAAESAGATVLGERFHQFEPHGASGVVLIGESHLSIHTWPERGFAAADLFTCASALDVEAAIETLRLRLRPARLGRRRIDRSPDRVPATA